MASTTRRDAYIISRSFRFLSPNADNADEILQRVDFDLETSYFSTAVGDNYYVNPLPGFGLNTDPFPALTGDGIRNGMMNMGRYYNRMIHNNVTTLTLTAAVPEFTGILPFLVNSFDYASSLVTNKGRPPSWVYYATQAVTSVVYYPLQLIGTGLNFLAYLSDTPLNSWYYAKKSMGVYLATAQGIYNDLMIASGYVLSSLPDRVIPDGNEGRSSDPYSAGTVSGFKSYNKNDGKADYFKYMNSIYPDAINTDGTIDVVKIIGRGPRKYRYAMMQAQALDKQVGNGTMSFTRKQQILENQLRQLSSDPVFMAGAKDNIDSKRTTDYLRDELNTVGRYRGEDEGLNPELASSYFNSGVAQEITPTGEDAALYQQYGGTATISQVAQSLGGSEISAVGDFQKSAGGSDKNYAKIDVNKSVSQDGWFGTVYELLRDSFLGGMDSVTFRVEGGTGPVTDSMSNQTKQPEIAGIFNGAVSAVSDFRFNVSGGKTGVGMIDSFVDTIRDGVNGLADGTVFAGPVMALFGNSKVHMPDYWTDSTSNLHTETFEVYCEANYGHPYAIATNILLPLALLAPFFTPVSSGGSTYTSPFLCHAFSKGRVVIKNGIVKNATLTFGEGPNGWTKNRQPLNMRVKLEIADLDNHFTIPTVRLKNALEVFNVAKTTRNYLGDIGAYNNWTARIGGRSYLDTMLKYNRLNERITRFTTDFQSLFSASRMATAIHDSVIGDILEPTFSKALKR